MRLAVVGLGSVGARHARNLVELGCDVIGIDPGDVPTPDGVRREDAVSAVSGSIDGAVVASPSSAHAGHAVELLEAGLPVLVEKPLATTEEDARRVAETAERHGLACGVAMNLRFHPAIRALRDLAREDRLGRILFAQVSAGYDLRRWRPAVDYRQSYSARSELGGGILLDAIHELDYVTWVLGEVASAVSEVDHVSELEIDVEDIALALLRMRQGALVSVDLNYLDVAYRRRCLLVGERATASWDWQRATVEILDENGDRSEIDVSGDVDETYVEEARQFLDVLRDGEAPITSAAEGVAAVRLVEAIRRAAATGSRVDL